MRQLSDADIISTLAISAPQMSAIGGKADMAIALRNVAIGT